MNSNEFVHDLNPGVVWRHFAALAELPRPSGKEGPARDYVIGWAREHGFHWSRDAIGNVVIRAPARGRGRNAPGLILQGHLDMVCEKDSGVEHDFDRDPIRLRREGERIHARGTTLGADNGIGVALALAAGEGLWEHHPPLELLLTVDEETGLSGVKELDTGLLSARRMINLDAEEEGVLYVGCAGGEDLAVTASIRRRPQNRDDAGFIISLRGLRGGHSGLDIIKNRGNAIRLLAHALRRFRDLDIPFSLVSIDGGAKRNAIPREARAVVSLPANLAARLVELAKGVVAELRRLHGDNDPGLELSIEPVKDERGTLLPEQADRLLGFLFTAPNGVLAMSQSIPGMVETSNNLGVVVTGEDAVEVKLCGRSTNQDALEQVSTQIGVIAGLCGLQCRREGGYPGWRPDMASPMLRISREVFRRLADGNEPEVTAIHAGLECGLLGDLAPGLDMISFGPDIRDAHSPNESLSIPSVAVVAGQLGALLEALCDN